MRNTLKVHKEDCTLYQGSYKCGTKYSNNQIGPLVSYNNLYWVRGNDDRKTTFGYVFCLGSRPMVWSCKKQKVVSLSTMKAKFCGEVNVGIKVV